MKKLDLFVSALIVVSLAIALAASFANVYAVLMGTGETVFIENKALTASLAALAPISSIALKLIGQCFYSTMAKKRYQITVHGVMALSVLSWVIHYSLIYSAPTGGLNIGFDEPTDLAHSMVFVQLITEILVATSLFVGLESILHKYQVEPMRSNANWTSIKKPLKELQQELDALLKVLAAKLSELGKLKAQRQQAINEAVASFNKAFDLKDQLSNL